MKLAVASCAKLQSTNPQPVWSEIQAERPDVLLLLGDTVYLSHDRHDDPKALGAELRVLYGAQMAEPNFAHLLNDIRTRGGELLAIYDDHDFLGNNRYGGDHGAALRESARGEFIRAFAPPQTGSDVFYLRRVGPADIVILDERFYRQAPSVSSSDRDAVLGSAQWHWLEQPLGIALIRVGAARVR
jgi:alkaline phosphatase D